MLLKLKTDKMAADFVYKTVRIGNNKMNKLNF